MVVYGRLIRYVTVIKNEVAIKVLIGILTSATYIGQAFAMAKAVSIVFVGGSFKSIIPYFLIALFAVLLRGALSRVMEGYNKVVAARVKSKIRMMVFDKILRLGPGYLGERRSGRVQSLVLDGIESLEPFLVNYIPQIITIGISGLGIGIYLATLDLVTGIVIILAMLLCVIVPYLTVPFVKNSIVRYWRSYATLNAQYIDAIHGMPTLMAFKASHAKGKELAENAQNFYVESMRNTTFSLLDSGIMMLLTSIASSVTVAIAAFRTDSGLIPVMAISTFLFLAAECARPMIELNGHWHNSFLGLSVAEELFEIVDKELAITEIENPDTSSLKTKLPAISIRDMSFAYSKEAKPALHNISIDIDAGQTVAVVGKSGSGKSTLVNLLFRFYDPQEGEILLNGIGLKNFGIEYLRSSIAVVFQDTFLFRGSVAENIRMAHTDASDETIIAAAKAAGAHDFISALPQGYETIIGERGETLSGGERQRISIARAIVKDAPLLILDEATSSVDAKSEAVIQETMEALSKGRTTIIIAHRLSTIQNADKIFVLDEGELAEFGTHKELLSKNGVYAGLINAQRGDKKNG
ncbi:MAG: ABC transporter ATP-binding protein [Oscillospiraceae bacterium]